MAKRSFCLLAATLLALFWMTRGIGDRYDVCILLSCTVRGSLPNTRVYKIFTIVPFQGSAMRIVEGTVWHGSGVSIVLWSLALQ